MSIRMTKKQTEAVDGIDIVMALRVFRAELLDCILILQLAEKTQDQGRLSLTLTTIPSCTRVLSLLIEN
jgi:hypothetical protein